VKDFIKLIAYYLLGLFIGYFVMSLLINKAYGSSLNELNPDLISISISNNKSDIKKLNITFTSDRDEIVYIVDDPKNEEEIKILAKKIIKQYRAAYGKN
jgi:hypothetical protein